MIPSLDFARNTRNTRNASTWQEYRKITPLFDSVSKHALPTKRVRTGTRDLIARAVYDTTFELVPRSRDYFGRSMRVMRTMYALSQEIIIRDL